MLTTPNPDFKVTPIFDVEYGSVTLNGITKRLVDRLQSVLNVAARLVHNSRKYDRISPLLRDLHWLRVPERIKFRLAVLVFRCRNQTAPNYLTRDLQMGRHGRLADTTAIGDNSEAARASHTTTNDRRPRFRRCCTARLERPAC